MVLDNSVNTDMSTDDPKGAPAVKYRIPSVGAEYRTLDTDLPLEQPLIFYLDGSKAFYLPHEDTSDESTHNNPQSVLNTLTNKRIFQLISIRQGQSGMLHVPITFKDINGNVPMDGYLIRFEGRDGDGNIIYDDEGFNVTQANLGYIDWTPSAVISQSAGYFKNAHFVIENADRTKILTTLDFSIKVIANDVALPVVQEFYASEYVRLLGHIKEMETSADHQINYLLNAYAAIFASEIKQLDEHVQNEIDKVDATLKAGTDKVDGYISESKAKLNTLNTDIDTAQTRMDALEKKISDNDLITKAGLNTAVQLGINTGEIDVNINDVILDKDISEKVDFLTGIIEGSETSE